MSWKGETLFGTCGTWQPAALRSRVGPSRHGDVCMVEEVSAMLGYNMNQHGITAAYVFIDIILHQIYDLMEKYVS